MFTCANTYCQGILTFDVDDDALADGRRYAVRCYTKISTHFRAADASQIKLFALVHSHCKIREAVLLNNRPTKRIALKSFERAKDVDCSKVSATSMSNTMKRLSRCIALILMKNSCSEQK